MCDEVEIDNFETPARRGSTSDTCFCTAGRWSGNGAAVSAAQSIILDLVPDP
jgi:hypothetical protein